MNRYSKFTRVLTAGHILDIVLALEHAGLPEEIAPSQLHAGADAVVCLATSLTRDIALTVSNPALVVEAGLAAMSVLAHEGPANPAGTMVDFECREGGLKGLPHTDKSASIRIQFTLPQACNWNVEKSSAPGQIATISGGRHCFVLGESSVARSGNTILLERVAADEISLHPQQGTFPPLQECLEVLSCLIEADSLYHTLSLNLQQERISIVFNREDRKIVLSAMPRRLFCGHLAG